MDIKFSFIIPAYNAENFIDTAIQSVLDMNRNDIEIIVINDGSTDKTREIVEQKIADNDNIILINIPNVGVSSARNIGLNKANGRYVLFLDADDKIVSKNMNKVLDYVDETNSILYVFDYEINNKSCILIDNADTPQNISAKNLIKQIFTSDGQINVIWRFVVNLAFLKKNHIRFKDEITIAEDMLFNFTIIKELNKICYVPLIAYDYTITSQSVTRSPINKNKLESHYTVDSIFLNFAKENTQYLDIIKEMILKGNMSRLRQLYRDKNRLNEDEFESLKKYILNQNILEEISDVKSKHYIDNYMMRTINNKSYKILDFSISFIIKAQSLIKR